MRTKLTVFIAGALTAGAAGTAQAAPASDANPAPAAASERIELAWLSNSSSNSSSNTSSNNGWVRHRHIETHSFSGDGFRSRGVYYDRRGRLRDRRGRIWDGYRWRWPRRW